MAVNTVLYIHSYPAATETLKLLWSGFKLLGWPIIGVETINGKHEWPEPIKTISIGVDKIWHKDRCNLPSRFINTLGHFLTTDYDRCCIIEYDTLILGPLPEYTKGLVTHLAGGRLPDCEAAHFYHTPWICNRTTAAHIITHGMKLIENGTCERGPHGSPDVFLGLIIEQLGLDWEDSLTFSANTIIGSFVPEARKALADGCVFFHGTKSKEHVDSILCAT